MPRMIRRTSNKRLSLSKRKQLFTDDTNESFIKNENETLFNNHKLSINMDKLNIKFKKTPQNSKRRCKNRINVLNTSPDYHNSTRLTEEQKHNYHKEMNENNKKLLKRSNSRKLSNRKRSSDILKAKTHVLKKYLRSKSKNRKTSESRKVNSKSRNRQSNKENNFKELTPIEKNVKTQQKTKNSARTSRGFSRLSKELNTKRSLSRRKREKSQSNLEIPCKEVKIDKILVKHIKKVKSWLFEKLYCRSSTDFKNLHIDSSNGVFLFDLINKIERKKVLKGKSIHNETSIKMNYKKIMEYLKKFERFNPRYLKASYYLINGDFNVFWGFLLDIYYFSLNKISICDRRYQANKSPLKDMDYQLSNDYFGIIPTDFESNVITINNCENNFEISEIEHKDQIKHLEKSSIDFDISPNNECLKTEGFEQRNFRENEFSYQAHTFGSDRELNTGRKVKKMQRLQPKISEENVRNLDYKELVLLEAKVKNWLGELGFEITYHCTIYEDQLRNGYVLQNVLASICNKSNFNNFSIPNSPEECYEKLKFFIEKFSEFDKKVEIFNPETILKGEPSTLWQFYNTIREIWESNVGIPETYTKEPHNSRKSNNKFEDEEKEQGIFNWVLSLNIYEETDQPYNFQEMLIKMGDGLLLSQIVERVFNVEVKRINTNPLGRMDCFNNIRFCIAEMRNFKSMNKRFFNRVKQIYDLNPKECLGILNDIKEFDQKNKLKENWKNGESYEDDEDLETTFKEDKTIKKKRYSSKEKSKDRDFSKNKERFLRSFDMGDSRERVLDDLDNRVIKTKDFKEISNTKREFFNQNISLYASKSNRKSHKKIEKSKIVSPDYKPPLSFHNVKTVIRLLVYLKMPKIIERENWDSSIWNQFSDGMTFASMINRLELKNVISLPHENARTTSDCLENLGIVLFYLGIDVEGYADKILRGEPKSIYTVVKSMWNLYSERIEEIENLKGNF